MLINLSNHPYEGWDESQKQNACERWSQVVDYPFPSVDPQADIDQIKTMAHDIVADIVKRYGTNGVAIHVMGEFCLTIALVRLFSSHGIECFAATSQRLVKEIAPGHKEVTFRFVQFRKYQ